MQRQKLAMMRGTVGVIAACMMGLSMSAAQSAVQSTLTASAPAEISRYDVYEITFGWESEGYQNVWEAVEIDLTLTAPNGNRFEIGGFYYEPDVWKARFVPDQVGEWAWTAALTDSVGTVEAAGQFRVTESDAAGWVRQNLDNPTRWQFDNGSAYHPLGITDCVLDINQNGTPMDDFGLDGELRPPGVHIHENLVDAETYFRAYGEAGFNLFRWSVDNCSFTLYDRIAPEGNVYNENAGKWGDQLVQVARANGMRVYLTIFGFNPPYLEDSTNEGGMAAVERAIAYVVNRYGAYVDFWELMNEARPRRRASDGWYERIVPYLRGIDPYARPISTSWERPDLDYIDILSPHWYANEPRLESDVAMAAQIDNFRRRRRNAQRPIIFGEQGNAQQNWDEESAERMRIRTWSAFFNAAGLIFFNTSFAKDFRSGNSASNIYLGVEERGYISIHAAFASELDADIRPLTVTVANGTIRVYGLISDESAAVYVVNTTDHANPTQDAVISLTVPFAGTGEWISPASGEVLGRVEIAAGENVIAVPEFTVDAAMRVG